MSVYTALAFETLRQECDLHQAQQHQYVDLTHVPVHGQARHSRKQECMYIW